MYVFCSDVCKHTWTNTCTYLHTHTRTPGLGNTVSEIDVSKANVFSKTVFSMVIPAVEDILKQDVNRKSVVLFGIEVRMVQNCGGRKEEGCLLRNSYKELH